MSIAIDKALVVPRSGGTILLGRSGARSSATAQKNVTG